jgi:methylase of polypeptide subunit release factors
LIHAGKKDIDNTGTLYWPAEEVLAYYCIRNPFTVETVVELGGGKSGLAALSILLTNPPKRTIITDGNADALEICV